MSMNHIILEMGLFPQPSLTQAILGEQEGVHTENFSLGRLGVRWVMGGTQMNGFHAEILGCLDLSVPLRVLLEGASIAEVWFLGRAGAFVHLLPGTQLTQAGELLPISTGNTAASEELGHSCLT